MAHKIPGQATSVWPDLLVFQGPVRQRVLDRRRPKGVDSGDVERGSGRWRPPITALPSPVREPRVPMDLDTGLRALLVVSVVSAAAPFLCAVLARFRVPQVVVLIVGGVLIGPEVAGLAQPGSIVLVANVGLGLPVPARRLRARARPVPGAGRAAGHGRLAGQRRGLDRGHRSAGSHRPRARLRPGGTGADHDRTGDAAADPPGQRHARRALWGDSSCPPARWASSSRSWASRSSWVPRVVCTDCSRSWRCACWRWAWSGCPDWLARAVRGDLRARASTRRRRPPCG